MGYVVLLFLIKGYFVNILIYIIYFYLFILMFNDKCM